MSSNDVATNGPVLLSECFCSHELILISVDTVIMYTGEVAHTIRVKYNRLELRYMVATI